MQANYPCEQILLGLGQNELPLHHPQLAILTQIAMWLALVLTVVSLVDYVAKNRSVIKDIK